MTPRRSTRIQAHKVKEKTPEPSNDTPYKPRGPRAFMKLNRSKQNLNKSELEASLIQTSSTVKQLSEIPEIIVTSPSKLAKDIEIDLDQVEKIINYC